MQRGITVRRADAIQLGRHATRLEALYRRCFTEPPWREPAERLAGFPRRLTAHLGRGGFDSLVAVDGNQLVAVIYGWPAGPELATGSEFDDALATAVTPAVAQRLVAPALIVAELMVHPDHQRKGIGRSLLTRFTAGWSLAWLCTHAEAPAARMYRQAGWREEAQFTVAEYPLVLFTWQARR